MVPQLSPERVRVVDEWRAARCKSPDDGRLVAEVLRVVARCSWQGRWRSCQDETEPGVIAIQPREGLFVHVRLWTGDPGELDVESVVSEGSAASAGVVTSVSPSALPGSPVWLYPA
jgi:hypothetical protein